ncbi:MAG: hypothetical protein J6A59_14505 [Lachnospiraceae bacterium]|nr:hypothetical protein [Lachnospiraceae bacterium]
MEIGNKSDTSIVDIQNKFTRNIFSLAVILVILITCLLYIILNFTEILEQATFYKLSVLNDYKIVNVNNYILLKNDESVILFRYDEKIDRDKEHNNIQTEPNILRNIDDRLDLFRSQRLGLDNIQGSGEGYKVNTIGKSMNIPIIIFESNIGLKDADTLIDIVQSEPVSTESMIFYDNKPSTIEEYIQEWMEEWHEHQLIKLGEDVESLRKHWVKNRYYGLSPLLLSVNTFDMCNIIEKYSTYTSIVIIDNGIIVGNCINKNEDIDKFNKVIDELILISLLEKTSII